MKKIRSMENFFKKGEIKDGNETGIKNSER